MRLGGLKSGAVAESAVAHCAALLGMPVTDCLADLGLPANAAEQQQAAASTATANRHLVLPLTLHTHS